MPRNKKYSKQDCIESLRQANEKVDGPITQPEYRSMAVSVSYSTIRNRFDNWNDAKESAGIEQYAAPELCDIPNLCIYTKEEWAEFTPQQRKRKVLRAHFAEVKMRKGCSRCGYDKHSEALDFHHINQEKKEFGIGQAISGTRSWEKIEAEVEKCEVICSNCHRVLPIE